MNGFENIKTKGEDVNVYGNTVINHSIRISLGLTLAEYCVADFIEYAKCRGKIVTYEYAQRRLGLSRADVVIALKSLYTKGFAETNSNTVLMTEKWLNAFKVDEIWFDKFWLINGKPFWPGSKPDAKAKFAIVCRKYPPDYIISCRDHYLKFMAHPSNSFRQLMGAPVFLNPEKERFNEDWLGNLKRLDHKEFPQPKRDPITREQKEAMFS